MIVLLFLASILLAVLSVTGVAAIPAWLVALPMIGAVILALLSFLFVGVVAYIGSRAE